MTTKGELRAKRKEKEQAEAAKWRETRRRERRCFWTWPFGHEWQHRWLDNKKWHGETRCAWCGKYQSHSEW